MLDYSGTQLHGLRQVGLHEVFEAVSYLTHNPQARQATEWLSCIWGSDQFSGAGVVCACACRESRPRL